MSEFVRREEFSDSEYSALGKFLFAITNLDDVVGRAAMKLARSGLADISEKTLDKKVL